MPSFFVLLTAVYIAIGLIFYAPKDFYEVSYVLLRAGRVGPFLAWFALSLHFFPNMILMQLEDILFPSLKEIERNFVTSDRIVFILGHPRSGTTNVHKAVSSLSQCQTGTYFDFFFPSIILKYIFYGIAKHLDSLYLFLSGHDVPNHKLGMFEELEEHLLQAVQCRSEIVSTYTFTYMGKFPEFVEDKVTPKRENFDMVKRIMSRIVYWNNKQSNLHPSSTEKIYVGCPLGFSIDPNQLRENFPKAKIIVCVRNPIESIPSYVDLITALTRQSYNDAFFHRFRIYYEKFCCNIYKSLAQFANDTTAAAANDKNVDPNVFWLDFDHWKVDSPTHLHKLWDFLGLDGSKADVATALARGKRHINKPGSYKVIDPVRIQKELGSYHLTMKKACLVNGSGSSAAQ